ncbi:hypothetical protein BMR22_21320 [Escherichia marmotae]|nr:hypothetical protein BMR22_21320 [Escherichia marmotae]
MILLILCEIINSCYNFAWVAQENKSCVKKGKKNRMRCIRLK